MHRYIAVVFSLSSTIHDCVFHNIFTDVYKQLSFTYTGKEDHLLWNDYGIEMHFLSTSEVHIEGIISVLSTNDENFIFPEGSELVSAVYDISANEPFPEPVTVRLQHCVPMESREEASAITFVVADTAKGPPYKFHPMSGGSFMSGSSYAEIQLTHFSMLAVIWWWMGYAIPFSASIYYLQNNMASFVVTKNLQPHINVSTTTIYCQFMHYSIYIFVHAGCQGLL